MADGTVLFSAANALPPVMLAALNWETFKVPAEILDDVRIWVREFIDDNDDDNSIAWYAGSANKLIDMTIESSSKHVISIRRSDDAIMFKLTFPDCKKF